jgi:hypothetical protein
MDKLKEEIKGIIKKHYNSSQQYFEIVHKELDDLLSHYAISDKSHMASYTILCKNGGEIVYTQKDTISEKVEGKESGLSKSKILEIEKCSECEKAGWSCEVRDFSDCPLPDTDKFIEGILREYVQFCKLHRDTYYKQGLSENNLINDFIESRGNL